MSLAQIKLRLAALPAVRRLGPSHLAFGKDTNVVVQTNGNVALHDVVADFIASAPTDLAQLVAAVEKTDEIADAAKAQQTKLLQEAEAQRDLAKAELDDVRGASQRSLQEAARQLDTLTTQLNEARAHSAFLDACLAKANGTPAPPASSAASTTSAAAEAPAA